MINILCIGDVVGQIGCEFIRKHLPALKKLKNIDITIANGENSGNSNGITPSSARHLFDSGVDVITGGNHTFKQREVYEFLDLGQPITRPANYPNSAPGSGIVYVDKGRYTAAVINVIGVAYMDPLSCPFEAADKLIAEAKKTGAKIIIADIHAEATSEKRAMGFYLDGKISALFGTHTHVQTADEQILPGGTGYITDLGMTGPINSVLGIKPAIAIAKLKDKLPVRHENAGPPCMINACIFEIDENTGLCQSVERLMIT